MAVTETTIKNTGQVKIYATSDADSSQLNTISIGTLADNGWDATKFSAIVTALAPCLARNVYQTLHVLTNEVQSDE